MNGYIDVGSEVVFFKRLLCVQALIKRDVPLTTKCPLKLLAEVAVAVAANQGAAVLPKAVPLVVHHTPSAIHAKCASMALNCTSGIPCCNC